MLAVASVLAAPSGAAADFEWVLTKIEPNPGKSEQPPHATGTARNGHIDYDWPEAPQAEFDVDFSPPPKRVEPGGKITFQVTVTGKLTGDKTVQGFRTGDAILLVNDRWDGRSAVGTGVSCADPIGAAPISCKESGVGKGPLEATAPTFGDTFSVGIGMLNCGTCYVRYVYTAKKAGVGGTPTKPPVGSNSSLGIDYTMPDRFGRRDPNGLVHYPTKKEIRPREWRVDFVVRRKDGKACAKGDVLTASAPGARFARGSRPCTFSLFFAKEGSPRVTVTLKARDGRQLKGTRQIVVQDWLIVGLGDSNGSGEGTPDIPRSGLTSATWQSVHCDRSANSYQAQTARAIERRDKRTSVTFVHLACSGASIEEGMLGRYGGINPGVVHQPQVKTMQALAQGREIDAVIISIGVNDLGFAALVGHCVDVADCPNSPFPQKTSKRTLNEVMQERLAALTVKGGLYDRLSRALKQAKIPARRVFITEYFDSTKDENGEVCNPLIGTPLGDFDQAEARWAADEILFPLNRAVRAAAQKHGWRLVRGSQQGYRRHGYCSQNRWIVGLVESLANQGDKNGTLHSTTRGNTFQAGLVVKRMRVEFYANGRTRRPAG